MFDLIDSHSMIIVASGWHLLLYWTKFMFLHIVSKKEFILSLDLWFDLLSLSMLTPLTLPLSFMTTSRVRPHPLARLTICIMTICIMTTYTMAIRTMAICTWPIGIDSTYMLSVRCLVCIPRHTLICLPLVFKRLVVCPLECLERGHLLRHCVLASIQVPSATCLSFHRDALRQIVGLICLWHSFI